jgi:hypothetical protein
LLIWGN